MVLGDVTQIGTCTKGFTIGMLRSSAGNSAPRNRPEECKHNLKDESVSEASQRRFCIPRRSQKEWQPNWAAPLILRVANDGQLERNGSMYIHTPDTNVQISSPEFSSNSARVFPSKKRKISPFDSPPKILQNVPKRMRTR